MLAISHACDIEFWFRCGGRFSFPADRPLFILPLTYIVLSYWRYFHFYVKIVTYVQFLKEFHTLSVAKIGYDIVSCIMKAQVKRYLRQLVMVTATGKGTCWTCWTCTATKGGSSGSTDRYLGCCVPFPFLGLLRFQRVQCLGQYNTGNNRYFVSGVTLLRLLVH